MSKEDEIMKNKIYPREKYLSKIRPFYDSDIVKVITGIRRSGKSFILKSVIKELESRNLSNRIIYLPLDKRGFKNITTPEQLKDKIEEQIKDSLYALIRERLIYDNTLSYSLKTNGSQVSVLKDHLTEKGKSFIYYLMKN